jgi:ATP/maltotriose-dependent transcriptional regulator MalT
MHRGWATCAHGWALYMSGETEKGLAEIIRGLKIYGPGSTKHLFLALQADVLLSNREPEAALASEVVEKIEGAPGEAELWRLKGEALLAGTGTISEAEAAIQQGLEVARRQDAKSWELRCATSMARLCRQQGRRQDALALLAPLYGWFTEGFDTADLRTARTLLDELTAGADAAA